MRAFYSFSMKKISRSKIDLFLSCPCCFYLDQLCKVSRPSIPKFTINDAVDGLLKKEFDVYRNAGKPHPLMSQFAIDAVPFQHPDIEKWRKNKIGIQVSHEATSFLVYGAIDDVWVDKTGTLYIVDYKATSIKDIPTLDGRDAYKRQIEVYQWLFRQNGFKVSNTGYFVYCNGKKNAESFNGRIDFDMQILSYEGDVSWVEPTLFKIRSAMDAQEIPVSSEHCEYCAFREEGVAVLRERTQSVFPVSLTT